jgi:hypothetical protein
MEKTPHPRDHSRFSLFLSRNPLSGNVSPDLPETVVSCVNSTMIVAWSNTPGYSRREGLAARRTKALFVDP